MKFGSSTTLLQRSEHIGIAKLCTVAMVAFFNFSWLLHRCGRIASNKLQERNGRSEIHAGDRSDNSYYQLLYCVSWFQTAEFS